jgi:hypothetical protein
VEGIVSQREDYRITARNIEHLSTRSVKTQNKRTLTETNAPMESLHAMGLSLKEGVYHALLEFSVGFHVEVALHGASTLEEAQQAAKTLRPQFAILPKE